MVGFRTQLSCKRSILTCSYRAMQYNLAIVANSYILAFRPDAMLFEPVWYINTAYNMLTGLGIMPPTSSIRTLPALSAALAPIPTLLPTFKGPTGDPTLYLGDGVVPVPPRLMKKIWVLEMWQLLPEAWVMNDDAGLSTHCCSDKRLSAVKRPEVKTILADVLRTAPL